MSPDARQLDVLRRCAEPALEHSRLPVEGGRVTLRLALSRHEITFVELVPVRETVHDGLDDRRLLGRDDDRLVAAHERDGAPGVADVADVAHVSGRRATPWP
jgi:xylan 1,4-beta-xylosidase